MKKTMMLFVLLSAVSGTSFAKDSAFCGSKNQWSLEEGKSGWYLDINYDQKYAFVIKEESPAVSRKFGYSIDRINGMGMNLSSPFGDTLSLVANAKAAYLGYATASNGDKETFNVDCFKSSAITSLEPGNLKINSGLYIVRELKRSIERAQYKNLTYLIDEKENIPFILVARRIQHAISDIGDWEDTILNPAQEEKVYQALKGDVEFQRLLGLMEKDVQQDPKLKKVGLLFGRDWYYSTGKVALVMSYENQLIVLPHEYDGKTKFGDPRLDYVY